MRRDVVPATISTWLLRTPSHWAREAVKKRVIRFRIQYEAYIEGAWREIVRYDMAHGRPHKDLIHPDGSQTKEGFWGYTPAEVLTYGQRDIKTNWRNYRENYEREMRR